MTIPRHPSQTAFAWPVRSLSRSTRVLLMCVIFVCPASAWAVADPAAALPPAPPGASADGQESAAVRAFLDEARFLESIGLTDKQRAILQRGADQARAAKQEAEQQRILRETMDFFRKSLSDEQRQRLDKLRGDVRDSGPFLGAGLTETQKAVIRAAHKQAEQVQGEPEKAAILLRAFDQVDKSLTPQQRSRLRTGRGRVEPGSVIGLDEKQKAVMYEAQKRARAERSAERRKQIMRQAWAKVKKTFTPEQKRRNEELLFARIMESSPLAGMPLTAEQFQTLQQAFAKALATTDRAARGKIMGTAFGSVARTLPEPLKKLYDERKQARGKAGRRHTAAAPPAASP